VPLRGRPCPGLLRAATPGLCPSPSVPPSPGGHSPLLPARPGGPSSAYAPQCSALPSVRAPTRRSSPHTCCAATVVLPSLGLVQPHPSSFSRRRCHQHHLPGPAQAPVRLDPPSTPSSPSLDLWLPRPSRSDSTLLRPSRLDPPSIWPNHVFPYGSVAVVAFPVRSVVPLLFCRGRGHHDRRRHVRCRRPPWQGSLTSGRSKKREG
jgi:hypothetical protein